MVPLLLMLFYGGTYGCIPYNYVAAEKFLMNSGAPPAATAAYISICY